MRTMTNRRTRKREACAWVHGTLSRLSGACYPSPLVPGRGSEMWTMMPQLYAVANIDARWHAKHNSTKSTIGLEQARHDTIGTRPRSYGAPSCRRARTTGGQSRPAVRRHGADPARGAGVWRSELSELEKGPRGDVASGRWQMFNEDMASGAQSGPLRGCTSTSTTRACVHNGWRSSATRGQSEIRLRPTTRRYRIQGRSPEPRHQLGQRTGLRCDRTACTTHSGADLQRESR
jgi:hypothetical protein